MKIFRLAMLAACVGAIVAPNFAAADNSGGAGGSPLIKALAPKAKERKGRSSYFNPFNAASRSRLGTTRFGAPTLGIGGVGAALSTEASTPQTVFRLSAPAAARTVVGSAPVVVGQTPVVAPTAGAVSSASIDATEVPTAGGSSSSVAASAVVPVRPPFRPPVRSPFRPPPRPPF